MSPAYEGMNRHEPIFSIGLNYVPPSFPLTKFTERQKIYARYLDSFSGNFLSRQNEQTGTAELYPLRINSIRNFAETIGFVLAGEAPDNSEPVTRSIISPKMVDFLGSQKEEVEKNCRFAEQVINQVWKQSAGRAKQLEAGIIAQYMGGIVYQLLWRDDRPDLLIPMQVKLLSPDLFMPVFDGDDPWHLLEGFVIHKITWQEAKMKYGIADAKDGDDFIYIEHWTKEKFTVTINGNPIRHEKGYLLEDVPHPFGEVPLYYIPANRVNDYYGIGLTDRVDALQKEYNARFADNGDAIYRNINPSVWVSGSTHPVQLKQIKDPTNKVVREYYDVGEGSALSKNKPEVDFEEPPVISESTLGYVDDVWEVMLRLVKLSDVVYGKDEGSQRSGLTLAFRMWPVTSLTKAQRMNFEVAYNKMGLAIIRAFMAKTSASVIRAFYQIYPDAPEFLENLEKRIDISQDWAPQIPRDRDQEVQEVVTLVAAELMPELEGMSKIGAKDPIQWQEMILEQKRKKMQLEQEMMLAAQPDSDPANEQLPNLRAKPRVDLEAGQNTVAPVSDDERE